LLGGGGSFGATFQKGFQFGDFVVFQTSQRGTFAWNSSLGAKIHEFLAIELQFFCESVNPSGHIALLMPPAVMRGNQITGLVHADLLMKQCTEATRQGLLLIEPTGSWDVCESASIRRERKPKHPPARGLARATRTFLPLS
jgi:hypothetical protein